jgi:hypothetical protein
MLPDLDYPFLMTPTPNPLRSYQYHRSRIGQTKIWTVVLRWMKQIEMAVLRRNRNLCAMDPVKQYEAESSYFEQFGLKCLRRMTRKTDNRLHHLNPTDLAELRTRERWTIGWACLAGAISGGILGTSELVVRNQMGEGFNIADWQRQLPYWVVYLAVALFVSGIEILFLYWNILRAVSRASSIAGVGMSGSEVEEVMARGLSRAALELPNPREPLYGIDPYARIPRIKLVAYTVLYRVKVGATSFLLRVLLRRVLARAAFRFFIPVVAIGVFAVWNGLITWWVLREARTRCLGPVAVQDWREQLKPMREDLGSSARLRILEAVAEAIVRSGDAHPNFVLLLHDLFEVMDSSPEHVQQVDWKTARSKLQELSDREKDAVLGTLLLTAMLDGRISRSEVQFLEDAHQACDRSFQRETLSSRHQQLLQGRGFDLLESRAE